MWTLRLLVIDLLVIGFCETTEQYIVRKIGSDTKRCIPISNCEPGHEILPCKVEYTKDICTSCPSGLVQPDYIQSTVDLKLTTCFENKNDDKCAAHDLEPSREYNAKACAFAKYCKCNTDECYYGDPCACSTRECGINESLHKNGTCVKCSPGTRKYKTGCGLCSPFQVTSESMKETQRPLTSMKTQSAQDVTNGNEERTVVTLVPSNGIMQSKGRKTQGREETTVSTITGSSNTLIAVIVVLAVLVIVAIVLIILLRNHRLKKDQEINVMEQGRPLVSPQNDMINNDNVENRNQEDNEIDGHMGNGDQNNTNTDDSTNNYDSRQYALSSDKRYQNEMKDIESAEELPKAITKYFDKSKDISSSSCDYSSGHHMPPGAQLNDKNTNTLNIHEAENPECQQQMQENVELAEVETLDEASIQQHSSNGYIQQLTEKIFTPVTQVSDERFDHSRGYHCKLVNC
ncbi:uncharacterized protein LOC127720707 isoform X2 [Mytilus californianus]|uniref:uncharacterized protein LOC127720707 isoform X2 n=1 Tax=Mytilus californianus TaxID=6549 RepID=UPI0022477129|nr:uncharacterized protein LOC127720707 isoform X2 [Mytilus californianus]